jgi:hypothetical protein
MGSLSEALASSLPLALAIAASPAAIIAVMILLMTRRAMINAYSFLAGWFFGLMLVGIIFLHRPGLYDSSGEPSLVLGWVRIILGTLIFVTGLVLLIKVFRKEGGESTPKWADKVDSFRFYQALMMGFFFAAPNVKNASMVITGSASIGSFGLSSYFEIGVLILFCLVASLGVLTPPVIFLLFRDKAEVLFSKMKLWLIRYRDLILTLICITFGGLFLYQGISIVRAF